MTFETISRAAAKAEARHREGLPPHRVAIAIRHFRTRTTGPRATPRIQISFGAQVLRELGWKAGDFVSFAFGSGSDHGLLRLGPKTEPTKDAFQIKGHRKTQKVMMTLPIAPTVSEEPVQRRVVSHQVLEVAAKDGAKILVLTVPPALRRAEPTARRAA